MAKVKTATITPVRRKGKPIKRNKVIKDNHYIPYPDLPEENEETANWYQDEDAYRRISSIRPQRDWDEEDELNVWWNWGN
ncbi:MAG: hypothetical protein QME64_03930 [bacterium]|nr:hypothetical protein [bacterium]